MSEKITKKIIQNQTYDNYWDFTLAWTDFNGTKFIEALRLSIDFIDKHKEEYSSEMYEELQKLIQKNLELNHDTSVRKGINQLVKLGFIKPFLSGYHNLAKEYLSASKEERHLLLSKIVYSDSSFTSGVTKQSDIKEINFIIKTLENTDKLHKNYLGTLMKVNIENYPSGFITLKELESLYRSESQKDFDNRKYNQISHLKILLEKLDGIVFEKDYFYLKKDSESEPERTEFDTYEKTKKRDAYLQRIYKEQLMEEVKKAYGAVKCMVEGLTYPILIASHIKPYKISNENEAFDPNNGLLLSKNTDLLFDKNYISFTDEGEIIFYSRVPDDVKAFWKNYKLDKRFLNKERCEYLAQHRKICEEEN